MGLQLPAAGSGALGVEVHSRELLKEMTIVFIISTIVCSLVKEQGVHSPTYQQKVMLMGI